MQRITEGFCPALLSVGWLTVGSVFVMLFLLAATLRGDDLVGIRVKVRLGLVDAGKFIDKLSSY